jgi:hypothetical protein
MRRRRLLLGVGLLALMGLAVGLAVWTATPRHHINHVSYETIKAGMTAEQVEAILGAPAGDYLMGRAYYVAISGPDGGKRFPLIKRPPIPGRSTWYADAAVIEIDFGPDHRVVAKRISYPEVEQLTPLDHLRAWLGW